MGHTLTSGLRQRALDAGFDLVVAKSRLLSALPELIEQYARFVDYSSLEADCQGQLSELGRKGVALFNQGAYFEAHEELELAWGAESGPIREVYRGILQVAVAYLHITRRNYRGAMKHVPAPSAMARSAARWLPGRQHCALT